MDNINETKVCTRCGRELPLNEFAKNGSSRDGHFSICKECERKRFQQTSYAGRNLALERIPWPFNDDIHEMDIEAIRENIRRKQQSAEPYIYNVERNRRKIKHRNFEK